MSAQNGSFDHIIERERGLQHTLSARRMTMIAIGGAVGTGLFLGSGFAISVAGPGVLVSYAIGAVIALLLMGCLAEMTVAHPTSGSFGAYAEYYVSPLAGFLVRYAYWSGNVLAVGTEVTAVGVYMHYWFPALPGWLSIVGFSALLIAVNARSVNVLVDEAELARRRETAHFEVPPAQTPWQELYRKTVGQLSTGGCLEPATLYLKVIAERGNPRHSH